MEYKGNELELFQNALNWKRYWISQVASSISGDVLEVGSGINANTEELQRHSSFNSWTCCEPDNQLIAKRIFSEANVIHGTLQSTEGSFDTILYIDVLEHIRDSRKEIELVHERLKIGGNLIILVPAFNQLFSAFDTAIGHYRRYNKARLREDTRDLFKTESTFFLDSIGVGASFLNKMFLHKEAPSMKDIKFYDKVIIPCSRVIDIAIGNSFGKSLIGIYKK